MFADYFISFVAFDPLRSDIPARHLTVGIEKNNGVVRYACYQLSERLLA
jgi:hypothetical protein